MFITNISIVGYNSLIYFVILTSSGVLKNQYLSSLTTCESALGIFTQGKNVYLSYYWSANYLSMYSTATSTFKFYYMVSIPSYKINTITSDWARFYLGGGGIHSLQTITLLNYPTTYALVTDTNVMNSYPSGADLFGVASMTLSSSSISWDAVASPTTDIISVTSSPEIATTDVQYYVNTITYSGLSVATTYSNSISITCSTDGSTVISYDLVAYNGKPLPSWVILDTANLLLNFTTPTISVTTTFQLAIRSTIGGDKFLAPISITVDVLAPVPR